MTEAIKPLDLEFAPAAAVSGAILLQSEVSTTLVCNAIRKVGGAWQPTGIGVVEFEICTLTKFGYPNDEAWSAIPRTRGLSYGFFEIVGSTWPEEVARLNRYAFPASRMGDERHFLALFHDSSFECLARSWKSWVTAASLAEVIADIGARVSRE